MHARLFVTACVGQRAAAGGRQALRGRPARSADAYLTVARAWRTPPLAATTERRGGTVARQHL